MGKTALIVKALDSNGKLLQKTVTDVNPDATNETLATFGQMVNALTTHTYSGTDRVDKINCDTEATPVDTRQEPTLTLSETSKPAAQAATYFSDGYYTPTLTYTGDGELSVSFDKMPSGVRIYTTVAENDYTHVDSLAFHCPNISQLAAITEPIVFTVKASGTETYKPAETTFTFTV